MADQEGECLKDRGEFGNTTCCMVGQSIEFIDDMLGRLIIQCKR